MGWFDDLQTADWRSVTSLLEHYRDSAGPRFRKLAAAVWSLPLPLRETLRTVAYCPDRDVCLVKASYSAAWEPIEAGLSGICRTVMSDVPQVVTGPAMLIKCAEPRMLGPLAGIHREPGIHIRAMGGPHPLASVLAGGALGAGVGYGVGLLGETLLPERFFERGRLRKSLAWLGGGLGAVPGLAWGLGAAGTNPDHPGWGAWLSGWPLRPQDDAAAKWLTGPQKGLPHVAEALQGVAEPLDTEHPLLKSADWAGGGDPAPIPVDEFNRTVWSDRSTPAALRAATSGLVGAAQLSQNGAPYVTPGDIARVALGAGSGYLSGLVVGKTLGALAGLTPDSQNKLQQVGLWSGILKTVIPLALG